MEPIRSPAFLSSMVSIIQASLSSSLWITTCLLSNQTPTHIAVLYLPMITIVSFIPFFIWLYRSWEASFLEILLLSYYHFLIVCNYVYLRSWSVLFHLFIPCLPLSPPSCPPLPLSVLDKYLVICQQFSPFLFNDNDELVNLSIVLLQEISTIVCESRYQLE